MSRLKPEPDLLLPAADRAAPPVAVAGAGAGLWLALGLALALALPFAVVTWPQMDDYAGHLARYHVMLNLAQDPVLQASYRIDWRLTGNLGAELLVLPLARVIGLAPAAKLVAAAIPVLTGLGLIAIPVAARRRVGVGTLLAMLAVWSPALRMGFLNYTLALALALLVFALWIHAAGRGWPAARRALVFVPAGLVVWLCHVSGWGVLGLMVFGWEAARARHPLRAALATWPLWPPLGLVMLTAYVGDTLQGDWGSLAYKKDILLQVLRGDHRVFDLLCLGLPGLALIEARARRALDPALLVPAGLVLAAALVLPRHFGGGDFADARLVPVALMLACLAVRLDLPGWALGLAAAPVALRLALLAGTWHAQSQALDRMLPALERLPVGARLASAVVRESTAWSYPAFSHAGAYATVRRDALVNAHFVIPGVHALQLRGAGADFADPSQVILWQAGTPIDLARFAPARQADYLWYLAPPAPAATPRVILPPGAVVLFATDRSLLLRLGPLPRR